MAQHGGSREKEVKLDSPGFLAGLCFHSWVTVGKLLNFFET